MILNLEKNEVLLGNMHDENLCMDTIRKQAKEAGYSCTPLYTDDVMLLFKKGRHNKIRLDNDGNLIHMGM